MGVPGLAVCPSVRGSWVVVGLLPSVGEGSCSVGVGPRSVVAGLRFSDPEACALAWGAWSWSGVPLRLVTRSVRGAGGAWVPGWCSERSRGAGSGPRGRTWGGERPSWAWSWVRGPWCGVGTTPPKVGGWGGLRNSALCVPLGVRCCEVRHQPTGEPPCKLRPRPPKP